MSTGLSLQEETPRNCVISMAGWVRLEPFSPPPAVGATRSGGRSCWQTAGFAVSILGECDRFTSARGWEVFVIGPARCAETVARALDASDGAGEAVLSLSDEVSRAISWKTFPAAAVIAVHPASGRACLIRDALGFRPLYYACRNDILHFSTNLPHLRSYCPETGVNTDLIVQMLVFGHRSGGRTLWQGINVVAPGRLIEFHPGRRPYHHQFWRHSVLFDNSERQRLERQSTEETLHEIGDALEETLATLPPVGPLAVLCGGGVDSTLLGAYLKQKGREVRFWTKNQVEAAVKEQDWMAPLSRQLDIPWECVNVTRAAFFQAYFEFLTRYQQPAVGPNFVSARQLRQAALHRGEQYFISGELCDTCFGGLSGFYYLSPQFRCLRSLSRLGKRGRFWLIRALAGERTWLLRMMEVAREEEMGRIAGGHLDRSELMKEIESIVYQGQSAAQRMGDLITWMDMRVVPGTLHNAFFEMDEWPGGVTHFPFAHARMIRFGLHLPYYRKRRSGVNKWIWRTFAARYIGKEAAFRKKCAFASPIPAWFDKAVNLLPNGFLEDLLCARVGDLRDGMEPWDPSRWTLVNLELWGRLNCWQEDPDVLMGRVL